MYKFLLLLLLSVVVNVRAQIHPPGAKASSLGGTGVSASDGWSSYYNQAGLANFSKFALSAHIENNFLVENLLLQAISFSFPTNFGTFGAYYSYYGFDLYNENKISMAYGKKLNKYLAGGIAIDYFRVNLMAPYHGSGALTGEIGLQAFLNEKWVVGMHVFNPAFAKFNNAENFTLPVILKLGTTYRFSKDFLLTGEIEKDLSYKETYKAGAEYQIVPNVYLRVGAKSNPFIYAFGVGFANPRMQADMSFENHPLLGYTIKISYSYIFFSLDKN